MVNMMFDEIISSINKIIIFHNSGLRFEGKILNVDDMWLKYFDKHKDKIRFVRLVEIQDFEVLDE